MKSPLNGASLPHRDPPEIGASHIHIGELENAFAAEPEVALGIQARQQR